MAYIIGIALVILLISNASKIIKQTPKILALGFVVWVAFEYTEKFFFGVGILVVLALVVGWYSERKLFKSLNKKIIKNDEEGVVNIFLGGGNDVRRKIINYLSKSNKSNVNSELLGYVFLCDFFDFAKKRGSGETLLFEKSEYEKYLRLVWSVKGYCMFDFDWVCKNFNKLNVDWYISEESPVDQKSGKRVNLVKLSKSHLVFQNVAIDLDDLD